MQKQVALQLIIRLCSEPPLSVFNQVRYSGPLKNLLLFFGKCRSLFDQLVDLFANMGARRGNNLS